jgi:dynein heavy chain
VCVDLYIYIGCCNTYICKFTFKVRIQKFIEDLESYEKQLEDLKSYGNLEDLPKYLKKVQHLDARIHNALDKIQCFNKEEDAYGWELSQFPQQKQVRYGLPIITVLYNM